MDAKNISEVMSWIKSTDLVEVTFREGEDGFALTTAEAPAPPPEAAAFPSRFVPVTASAVGLFQAGELGRPRLAEEGRRVAEGDLLGLIDGGGKPEPIKAPCAGRIARVLAEAGSPVEFGQPILFIEPA